MIIPEVWDGSEYPLGGPGLVWGPSGRSGMGRGTLSKVLDGLGNPLEGTRWVR